MGQLLCRHVGLCRHVVLAVHATNGTIVVSACGAVQTRSAGGPCLIGTDIAATKCSR